MNGSDASGGKVFGRFTEPAHQVLDLARAEAERAGHRYLGPEHVLLGLPAEGHSRAAQLLRTAGVELAAVREATRRVTRRRWWWSSRVVWTPLCGLPLVAKRALQLASQQAQALGVGEVRPEHLLLGVLEDAQQPTDKPQSSRRHRQVIAHVGLPDGYHGAAGPLLAGLEIDLGRLQEAVAAELRGSQR
jgi:ATP-dependent Clp protease ATP-binding subunit ClpA